MADAPRKRPWLQIHLSTAVVLMLEAAILLGVNLRTYKANFIEDGQIHMLQGFCGWPFDAYPYHERVFWIPIDSVPILAWAGNVMVAGAILFATTVWLERWYRVDDEK